MLEQEIMKTRGHHIWHLIQYALTPERMKYAASKHGLITEWDQSFLVKAYQRLTDLLTQPEMNIQLVERELDGLCKYKNGQYCPNRNDDPQDVFWCGVDSSKEKDMIPENRRHSVIDISAIEGYGWHVGQIITAREFVIGIGLWEAIEEGIRRHGRNQYPLSFQELDLQTAKESFF
jgi:hypothetical protein